MLVTFDIHSEVLGDVLKRLVAVGVLGAKATPQEHFLLIRCQLGKRFQDRLSVLIDLVEVPDLDQSDEREATQYIFDRDLNLLGKFFLSLFNGFGHLTVT